MTAAAAAWTPPNWGQASPTPIGSVRGAAAPAWNQWRALWADPRVVTGELLFGILLVVAFRHPITSALGTAGAPVPEAVTSDTSLPPASAYVDLPRAIPRTPADATQPTRDPFIAPDAPSKVDTAPATTETTTAAQPAPSNGAGDEPVTVVRTYRIKRGDSLWSIAEDRLSSGASNKRITAAWRAIYDANRAVIGPDPSNLSTGSVLDIPTNLA